MTKPKISAAKVPLQGWIAQIWVESYRQWFDLTGCPYFKNPDHAIAWGLDQIAWAGRKYENQ